MSLLGNLKKIKDAAVKKISNIFAPKPSSGGGGSWGPTTTAPKSTPPPTNKPVTWGLNIDTSYKMPNMSVANSTPAYGKSKVDVQGAINAATGGKSGPMTYAPGAAGGMSMAPTGNKPASQGGGRVGGGGGGGGGGSYSSKSSSKISIPASPSGDGLMSLYSLDGGYSAYSAPSETVGSTGTSTGTKSGSGSSGGGGGGASGSSPADQLAAIRAEAERLQAEVAKLYEQEQTAANDAVTSDTEEVNYEKEALKKLKEAGLLPDDSALKLLNDEIKRNEQNLKDNLANINAAYNVQKTGMEGQQLGETGQTSMAIANAGGYLGFSGSGTGVMLKLAESHRAELTALESQRQNALQEARNAAAERRFDIVRLKADEIARIDQEKYERVQEYNAEVKKQAAADLERAKTLKVEEDIMGAIIKGNTSVEDIYKAMKGTATVDEIKGVLDAVTKKSTIAGGFKISAANVAKFLGAGMTQDDVNALQEYVNENGYDETVRSSLTPAQRAVADKVFNLTGTSESPTAVMALTDLARIEEQYGVTFPYGVTKGEVETFIQDNWGASAAEMQEAIDLIFGKQTPKTSTASSMITEEYLRSNYTVSELQNLSAKTGAASFWTGGATDVNRMFKDPVYMSKLKKLIDTLVNQEGYSMEDALTQLMK